MHTKRKKDKVYYHQILLLIVILRMMVGLTYLPVSKISPANQDAWIVLLMSIPYTIIFCLPLLYLSNKFNKYNLLEVSERIMGKFFGRIIAVFYSITFFIFTVFFSSVFVEILDSSLFRRTPTIVSMSILLITCAYIVNKGLTNMARLVEIIVPIILLVFFILAILAYDNYDFTVLLPILSDSTFTEINAGAINIGLRYIDILVIAMIVPNLDVKTNVNKIFIRALIYSIFIIILASIVVQATFGIEYVKRINFPYFTFARLISIGEAQGFDALYISSWILGHIIKISAYIYFTSVALGKVANRGNQKFKIPIAIAILIIVLLIKDRRPIVAVDEPIQQIMMTLSVSSIIVVPSIISIVYLFRKKNLKNINKSMRQ